ncbi:MAG: multiheme c-type cytochrome, partial [Candidatus Binatia bacterium]
FAGLLIAPRAGLAVEPSARAVTGQLPLVGDREIFQPGTQPCTLPGVSTSCFHTDHTDEFDRKFHPAQNDVLLMHSGELPVASDGTNPPRLELACGGCHGGYADYSPFDTWRGTMMAQAWRDPLARAAIAVANHGLSQAKIDFDSGLYDDGPRGQTGRTAGDMCIRCHSPIGWLEGNSLPADGSRINGKQMDGVQCDFCHRIVNPIDPRNTYEVPSNYNVIGGLPDSLLDPQVFENQYVPALHNGNFIVNQTGRKIGPHADPVDLEQHPLDALVESDPEVAAANSSFMRSSQLCAVCHNVTNPILRIPAGHAAAGQRVPVERTYTEWYFSDFGPTAKGNPNLPLDPTDPGQRSCQDCHMPKVDGFGADPSLAGAGAIPERQIAQHTFVGGNTWAQDMIPFFFPDQLPLIAVFDAVQEKARQNLESAAELSTTLDGATLRVEVENLTGHKLPTGYPEGRRMWLHVVGYDASGARVFESGGYDAASAELAHDASLKLWAAEYGIRKPGEEPTPSFHFILNNVILKDNRIPPEGFDVARAAAEAAVIVRDERDCDGYVAAFGAEGSAAHEAACDDLDFSGSGEGESDGKDVVFYDLSSAPAPVAKVDVTLRYQTASKEYIDFLTDPNNTGDYTDRFTLGLKLAWQLTGMSPPVAMRSVVGCAPGPPCQDQPGSPS